MRFLVKRKFGYMERISYLCNMKKYYIYHIKGKKIGCTQNPKKRIKDQGFTNYEILEEHTDIIVASEREMELQREYGYPVDAKPYWKTIKMPTTESCSKGGKIGGKIAGESNAINGNGFCNTESRSKGGKTNVDSGHLERIQKARQRPVIQMDRLGNVIQDFKSGVIAGDVLNLSSSHITRCCKGKLKTIGGFTFKYK